MSRPWKHKEILFLTQTVDRCGLPWCASELHRTVEECARKLEELRGAEAGADEWLTPKEAGALASCASSTIRTEVVAGRIEGRKDSKGRWMVKRESVIRYASEHGKDVENGRTREKASRSPQGTSKPVLQENPRKASANAPDGRIEAKIGISEENPALLDGWVEVDVYAEAAEMTHARVARLCEEGKLSGRKFNGRWLVSETELVIAKSRPELKQAVPGGYVPLDEAARRLNRHPKYLQHLCREGKLKAMKGSDNHWLVAESALAQGPKAIHERDLPAMSRLDILKALAGGASVGGYRA